jgi:hypothetical protein
MTRIVPASCLALAALAALVAGVSDPAPPAPDPAKVERALASLDEQEAAEPEGPAKFEEKLQKADRIAGTLSRVQPEKIDPNVAVALVAR